MNDSGINRLREALGEVSGWCRKEFGVALLTTQRALNRLLDLGLVEPKAKGRSARDVLKTAQ